MVTQTTLRAQDALDSIRTGRELNAADAASIRRRMVLDGFKWDPQVGDTNTIAPFPIILRAACWRELASLAEKLASELSAAEAALFERPDLHGQLGLPWRFRQLLRRADRASLTPSAARALRFDFHLTDDGWRISEVNSDVPGGFTEASNLPALMMPHYPGTRTAGHPADVWADALCETAAGAHIGLLAATGFMEDQQIMAYLASLLGRRGFIAHFIGPRDIVWRDGLAYTRSCAESKPLSAIVRFFQAEWLASSRRKCGWPMLFVGGRTPVTNPATAALVESKRFPLIWDKLGVALPTWRSLLPETRAPRDAPWQTDDGWLVKSALCNTGDTVSIRELLTPRQWHRVCRDVRWRPGHWLAQRRFSPMPLDSPAGKIYPCFGVYTINGRASGIYGRFSLKPLIDFAATDVAVLIEEVTDDA
jgi:glutathionylspermidine synthase